MHSAKLSALANRYEHDPHLIILVPQLMVGMVFVLHVQFLCFDNLRGVACMSFGRFLSISVFQGQIDISFHGMNRQAYCGFTVAMFLLPRWTPGKGEGSERDG